MDQDVALPLLPSLHELDCPVEQALDVLILTVLEEEGQVGQAAALEPVLTVVPCAIDHRLDVVLL